jgi:hypothetical protein
MKQKTAKKAPHNAFPAVIAADSFVCHFLTCQLIGVLTETWAGTAEHETARLLHHELRHTEYVPLPLLQVIHAFLERYMQSSERVYS